MQSMLSAASGQSLMAFQMSMQLNAPPPCSLITSLMMEGHTRFLSSDPDSLFANWALQAHCDTEYVIDFQCPLKIMHMVTNSRRTACARRESKQAAAKARP